MDISSLYTSERHNSGAQMQVCDEMGTPTDLYIKFQGQDADEMVKYNRDNRTAAISRLINGEESETDENLMIVLESAIGWEGFEQDGKKLEFSKETMLVLLTKAPYIVDQATLFINQRSNFIKA